MTRPEFNTVVTVPKPHTVVLDRRPYPNVRPGSLLVKTEIAALCVDDRMYTDHVHEWFDSPLYGLGHEGVGTVLEAPESPTFKPGDRVLISHGAYCGRCFACQNGLSQAHCASLSDGSAPGQARLFRCSLSMVWHLLNERTILNRVGPLLGSTGWLTRGFARYCPTIWIFATQ